jgi:hypothetical protein
VESGPFDSPHYQLSIINYQSPFPFSQYFKEHAAALPRSSIAPAAAESASTNQIYHRLMEKQGTIFNLLLRRGDFPALSEGADLQVALALRVGQRPDETLHR